MVDNAKPSMNPSNDGSLTGMINEVFKNFLKGVNDMLPCRVLAFNGDRNNPRVSVEFLILMVTTQGQLARRGQVASVPVFQMGAGNVIMSYNINAGDLGWIKATDRDLFNFVKNYDESQPNTGRMHSFEDGIFFPNVMKGYTIDGEDDDNFVIQTLDGTQRIAVWDDRIKITSDQEIILDAPLVTITGDLDSGVDTGGSGTATFHGSILADGDVRGDVDGDDISLNTHVHINGGGTGDSGPPKP